MTKQESPVTKARPGQVYRMKSGIDAGEFLKRYSSYRAFISSISNGLSFTLTRFKNNRTSIDGDGKIDVFGYSTIHRDGLELAISDQMIDRFFDEVKELKEVVSGRRYVNIETGNEYMVLHLANIASPTKTHPVQVVYIGETGNVWTETLDVFKQRFKE